MKNRVLQAERSSFETVTIAVPLKTVPPTGRKSLFPIISFSNISPLKATVAKLKQYCENAK
jgi:hypothetical protein